MSEKQDDGKEKKNIKELGSKGQSRRDFLKLSATTLVAAGLSGKVPFVRAADPPIRVGITLAYSGLLAMTGPRIEHGIRLALAQSRYRDRVKYFIEDTQVKPEVAIEKARKLFEKDRVHLIAGPIMGHESLAVSQFLKAQKRLMLLAFGGNIQLCGSDCSRYTFLCNHTPWNQSAPAVDWFLKTFGKKVFLFGADYSVAHDVAQYFQEPFEKKGGKVVGSFFCPLGTTEYAPYLAKIQSANPKPDALFGLLSGNDCINFVKQYDEFGLHKEGIPAIFGLGALTRNFIGTLKDAAVGHYNIFHWSPWLENPQNKTFLADYKKMFNEDADEQSICGYEVGMMMVKGLEATKGNPEDTEGMIRGIEKLDYVGPRGRVRMDPNHVANVPIYAFKIQKKGNDYFSETVASLGTWGTPYGADGPGGSCKISA
jgi:branched-chain amino acid transport system substrate-binding protein